jgi:hypothetical protein
MPAELIVTVIVIPDHVQRGNDPPDRFLIRFMGILAVVINTSYLILRGQKTTD